MRGGSGTIRYLTIQAPSGSGHDYHLFGGGLIDYSVSPELLEPAGGYSQTTYYTGGLGAAKRLGRGLAWAILWTLWCLNACA